MAFRRWFQRFFTSVRARSNRIWLLPTIGVFVAILLMSAAAGIGPLIPAKAVPNIDEQTLVDLLTVLSSSMLAVTTFSLSLVVSAYANASSSATPRATELIMADSTTHTALATFITAFVYSIIAQAALGFGVYSEPGRFVLMIATVGVLAWLVVTLIRWIRTLTSLGLLKNTLDKLEAQARQEVSSFCADPGLGARVVADRPDGDTLTVARTGYLTRVDVDVIDALASHLDVTVHLLVRPGEFLARGVDIAVVQGMQSAKDREEFRDLMLRYALEIDPDRTFDQDPKYALILLTEVAERALSPAVNDPGTAIQVISRLTAVFVDEWSEPAAPEEVSQRVSMCPLDTPSLLADAFAPIARDGAGHLEVMIRQQKSLGVLARSLPEPLAGAARAQSELALRFASSQLPDESQVEVVRELAEDVSCAGGRTT